VSNTIFKQITAALVCTLILVSCQETANNSTNERPEPASTSEAVMAFTQGCLASLPEFSNLAANAEKAGLTATGRIGPIRQTYSLPGKTVITGIVNIPGGGSACMLTVDSLDNSGTLGAAILKSARDAGGQGKEKSFPSSFYKFAIQLPNGSLIFVRNPVASNAAFSS
jgi:hypothetical protein